jgi:hypothetical protein
MCTKINFNMHLCMYAFQNIANNFFLQQLFYTFFNTKSFSSKLPALGLILVGQ